MRKLILLIAALSLTACTTNGQFDVPKTWLLVGAVAVSVAVASQNESADKQNCHWVVGPNGSHQVCR